MIMKTVGVNAGCDGTCQETISKLQERIKELEATSNANNELLANQRIIELSEKEWAKFDELGGDKWLHQRLKFVKVEK